MYATRLFMPGLCKWSFTACWTKVNSSLSLILHYPSISRCRNFGFTSLYFLDSSFIITSSSREERRREGYVIFRSIFQADTLSKLLQVKTSRSRITVRWAYQEEAKYLGITLTDELSWSSHVRSIHNGTNSTLVFLRRNLRRCPAELKETAYITLVRSILEYAAPVWDPHLARACDFLEKIERRSARFVKGDHRTIQSDPDAAWSRLARSEWSSARPQIGFIA